MLVLVAVSVSCAVLAGCDTATEHATVENQCGETLTIAISEGPSPVRDETARYLATEFGEVVAPGSSTESYLMAGAGGFVVDALAADGSVYNQWYSFKDPERSFVLSKETGTCPS
jgi:hypothetical protein